MKLTFLRLLFLTISAILNLIGGELGWWPWGFSVFIGGITVAIVAYWLGVELGKKATARLPH